jgi:hypothetical protein
MPNYQEVPKCKRKSLGDCQEGHGICVVRVELPGSAVVRVNPDFIRKKHQSLASLVAALSSYDSVPF